MKPITQLEKRVWSAHQTLPLLNDKYKEIIMRESKNFIAYRRKNGTCHCLACGKSFTYTNSRCTTIRCPHCGRLLVINDCTNTVKDIRFFYNILDVHEGFQVVRGFYVDVKCRVGCPYEMRQFIECADTYISSDGKRVDISYPLNGLNCYRVNIYRTSGKMSIRRDDKHSIEIDALVKKLIPQLKRYGYKNIGYSTQNHIVSMLVNNHYQTLMQAKRYDLINGFVYYRLENWWWQIRMCLRRDYMVKDISMWTDTLRLAELLGLDLHSPKYVCPDNLKAMHDQLMKRKQRKDKEELLKREHERMLQDIEECKESEERLKRYELLKFERNGIVITALTKVMQFQEEGDAMNHCVFTNKYHKKPLCLILSAKDCDGKRLATIEYDLDSHKVMQCRSKNNQVPVRCNEIVKLVTDNENVIERYRTSDI